MNPTIATSIEHRCVALFYCRYSNELRKTDVSFFDMTGFMFFDGAKIPFISFSFSAVYHLDEEEVCNSF